jgi:exosortase
MQKLVGDWTKHARLFAALLVALLLVALTWPALRWLWGEWWGNAAYSHGSLIPLVSLFLAWRQIKRAWAVTGTSPARETGRSEEERPGTAWVLPLALVVCSLGAIVWATAARAFYLVALAVTPLLAGALWYVCGRAWTPFAFAIGYWLFAVPLPLVDRLSVPLQALTVGVSTTLVRWSDIGLVREGSRVILPSCDLVVGAPCSGLHSLVALLALAAVMAHVLRGRYWARCLLCVLAVPVALASNLVRVLALMLVAERWGAETALGLWHDWSGVAFFGLATLVLIGIGRWLGCRELRADI